MTEIFNSIVLGLVLFSKQTKKMNGFLKYCKLKNYSKVRVVPCMYLLGTAQ